MTYAFVVLLWLGGDWREHRSRPMTREACHELLVAAHRENLIGQERNLLVYCDRTER